MDRHKIVYIDHWPDGNLRTLSIRDWNVQGKPYRDPLQFSYTHQAVLSYSDSSNPDGNTSPSINTHDNSSVRNRAYERLMSSLGNQSSWGTNLAEARQSVGTCEARARQLARFAGALGKRNWGGFVAAAQILKMSAVPPGVSKKKSFSDNFLEYHFGWAPAMQDIHDAVDTMSKADFGSRKIRGSASSTEQSFVHQDTGFLSFVDTLEFWTQKCAMGCRVRIANDSAFLASQMGLVNPLTVAWDLVPFSFVVDWFTNVGQILGAMTGFVGLEVTLPYSTSSESCLLQHRAFAGGVGGSDPQTVDWDNYSFVVERIPGIIGPVLALKPFKGFSPVRAATAIALLLQKTRRGEHV